MKFFLEDIHNLEVQVFHNCQLLSFSMVNWNLFHVKWKLSNSYDIILEVLQWCHLEVLPWLMSPGTFSMIEVTWKFFHYVTWKFFHDVNINVVHGVTWRFSIGRWKFFSDEWVHLKVLSLCNLEVILCHVVWTFFHDVIWKFYHGISRKFFHDTKNFL